VPHRSPPACSGSRRQASVFARAAPSSRAAPVASAPAPPRPSRRRSWRDAIRRTQADRRLRPLPYPPAPCAPRALRAGLRRTRDRSRPWSPGRSCEAHARALPATATGWLRAVSTPPASGPGPRLTARDARRQARGGMECVRSPLPPRAGARGQRCREPSEVVGSRPTRRRTASRGSRGAVRPDGSDAWRRSRGREVPRCPAQALAAHAGGSRETPAGDCTRHNQPPGRVGLYHECRHPNRSVILAVEAERGSPLDFPHSRQAPALYPASSAR
jgi:hypothetical protein